MAAPAVTFKPGLIKTAPIHFGEPDVLKRFRYIVVNHGLDQQVLATIRNRHNGQLDPGTRFTDYEVTVEITVTMPVVHLEVAWEARYLHRVRMRDM